MQLLRLTEQVSFPESMWAMAKQLRCDGFLSMKTSRHLMRDSVGGTDQYETTAAFLEDLAAHTPNEKERQRFLGAAHRYRSTVLNSPAGSKRSKGDEEPSRRKPKSSRRVA